MRIHAFILFLLTCSSLTISAAYAQSAPSGDCATITEQRPVVACSVGATVNVGTLIIVRDDSPVSIALAQKGRYKSAVRLGTDAPSDVTDGIVKSSVALKNAPIAFIPIFDAAGATIASLILVDGRVLPIASDPANVQQLKLDLGPFGTSNVSVDEQDTLHFAATEGSILSVRGAASSKAITLQALFAGTSGDTPVPIELTSQAGALTGTAANVKVRLGGFDVVATDFRIRRDANDTTIQAAVMPALGGFGPLLTNPATVAWNSHTLPAMPCFALAKSVGLYDGGSSGPLAKWKVALERVRTAPAACTSGASVQGVSFDIAATADTGSHTVVGFTVDQTGLHLSTPGAAHPIAIGRGLRLPFPLLRQGSLNVSDVALLPPDATMLFGLSFRGTLSFPGLPSTAAPQSYVLAFNADTARSMSSRLRCGAERGAISFPTIGKDVVVSGLALAPKCGTVDELVGFRSQAALTIAAAARNMLSASLTVAPFDVDTNGFTFASADLLDGKEFKGDVALLGQQVTFNGTHHDGGALLPQFVLDGTLTTTGTVQGSLGFQGIRIDPNPQVAGGPARRLVTMPTALSVAAPFTIANMYKLKLVECSPSKDDAAPAAASIALDPDKLSLCGYVELPALTRKRTHVNFADNVQNANDRFSADETSATIEFAALFDGAKPRYGVRYRAADCSAADAYMEHFGVFDGCIRSLELRYATESGFVLSCPKPEKNGFDGTDVAALASAPAAGLPYWVMCATAHFTKILPPDNKALLMAAFDTRHLLATADLTDVKTSIGKDTISVDQIRIVMFPLERSVHVQGSYTAGALGGTTVYFRDIGFVETKKVVTDAHWAFHAIADVDKSKTFWNNVGKWAAEFMTYFSLHGFKLHGN